MFNIVDLMEQLANLAEMEKQLDETQRMINEGHGKRWMRDPRFRDQLEAAQLRVYEQRAQVRTVKARIYNEIVCPN